MHGPARCVPHAPLCALCLYLNSVFILISTIPLYGVCLVFFLLLPFSLSLSLWESDAICYQRTVQCALPDTKKGGEKGRERESVERRSGGREGGMERGMERGKTGEGGVGKAASLQRCAGSPHALGNRGHGS